MIHRIFDGAGWCDLEACRTTTRTIDYLPYISAFRTVKTLCGATGATYITNFLINKDCYRVVIQKGVYV